MDEDVLKRLSELLRSRENIVTWADTPEEKEKRESPECRVMKVIDGDGINFGSCMDDCPMHGYTGDFCVLSEVWYHMLKAGKAYIDAQLRVLGVDPKGEPRDGG